MFADADDMDIPESDPEAGEICGIVVAYSGLGWRVSIEVEAFNNDRKR